MRHLHPREQVYLCDTLYEACGGEKKKAVNLSKVREILDGFPELVNDEVGPKRVSFLPSLRSSLLISYCRVVDQFLSLQ